MGETDTAPWTSCTKGTLLLTPSLDAPRGIQEFMTEDGITLSRPGVRTQMKVSCSLRLGSWEPWPAGQGPCQPHPTASKKRTKAGLEMAAGIGQESRSPCWSMVTGEARV